MCGWWGQLNGSATLLQVWDHALELIAQIRGYRYCQSVKDSIEPFHDRLGSFVRQGIRGRES